MQVPEVFIRMNLEYLHITLLLFSAGITAVISSYLSSRYLITKFGHHIILHIGLFLISVSIYILFYITTYYKLILLYLLIGGIWSTTMLALRTKIALLEKKTNRIYFGLFELSLSTGGMLGALITYLIHQINSPSIYGYTFLLGLQILFILIGLFFPLKLDQVKQKKVINIIPYKQTLVFGLLLSMTYCCYGYNGDWSPLWLSQDYNLNKNMYILPFLMFTFGESITRICLRILVKYLTEYHCMITLPMIGGFSFILLLTTNNLHIIVFAFFILGLLSAGLTPILFRNLLRLSNSQDESITLGDSGIIATSSLFISPVILGLLAQYSSLTVTTYLIGLLWIAVVLFTKNILKVYQTI